MRFPNRKDAYKFYQKADLLYDLKHGYLRYEEAGVITSADLDLKMCVGRSFCRFWGKCDFRLVAAERSRLTVLTNPQGDVQRLQTFRGFRNLTKQFNLKFISLSD